MFLLGLITADQALAYAIGEQLKLTCPDVHYAVFSSPEDALAVWGERLPAIIFWDAETAPITEELSSFLVVRLADIRPEPFLMVLGDVSQTVQTWGIAEHFIRPLRLGYFLGRVQFYKRQLEQSPDVQTVIGLWSFTPRARQLVHHKTGEIVKLTDKETALLDYLWQAQEIISREEILAALWGYEADLDTHTLETHIYRLRRKLMPPDYEGEDVFQTLGGGYQIHPSWRKEQDA